MKRILVSTLAILMLLSLVASAMAAPTTTYSSTLNFLETCDAKGKAYNYIGMNSDNNEEVRIDYDLDNTSITARLFFEDEYSCGIRVWYLMDYDPARLAELEDAVNTLNSSYRWVRVFCDKTDNTITIAADVEFGNNPSGEIVWTVLGRVVGISNICYNELEQYKAG